jgi:hypothetical protein
VAGAASCSPFANSACTSVAILSCCLTTARRARLRRVSKGLTTASITFSVAACSPISVARTPHAGNAGPCKRHSPLCNGRGAATMPAMTMGSRCRKASRGMSPLKWMATPHSPCPVCALGKEAHCAVPLVRGSTPKALRIAPIASSDTCGCKPTSAAECGRALLTCPAKLVLMSPHPLRPLVGACSIQWT